MSTTKIGANLTAIPVGSARLPTHMKRSACVTGNRYGDCMRVTTFAVHVRCWVRLAIVERQVLAFLAQCRKTIDNASSGETLYDPRDINKVQRLATLFEMYEAWENGDYTHAKAIADGLNPPLPDDAIPWSIVELGDVWPSAAHISNARSAADSLLKAHMALKQGTSHPSDSLFTHPTKLLAYVRDELAKIERLIDKNEDYRSAYLRAAGLHEFCSKHALRYAGYIMPLRQSPKVDRRGSRWLLRLVIRKGMPSPL
jgi:hypothetical protein